ncbi:MAG: 30S ribosomal protein S8 [Patescibacteria group bacterium]|nr:30S ribosomal protein S8 [Patescibacteria group bacterium]
MDQVANALTKLRNISMVGKPEVSLRKSRIVENVMRVLEAEGFIKKCTVKDSEIVVEVLYDHQKPVLTSIKKVSKGGQRKYVSWRQLKPVMNGRGIGIISTSSGVMSSEEAKLKKLGGEYICKVW